jgi:hypothetical protein
LEGGGAVTVRVLGCCLKLRGCLVFCGFAALKAREATLQRSVSQGSGCVDRSNRDIIALIAQRDREWTLLQSTRDGQ